MLYVDRVQRDEHLVGYRIHVDLGQDAHRLGDDCVAQNALCPAQPADDYLCLLVCEHTDYIGHGASSSRANCGNLGTSEGECPETGGITRGLRQLHLDGDGFEPLAEAEIKGPSGINCSVRAVEWPDRVVPFAVEFGTGDVWQAHLLVRDHDAFGMKIGVEFAAHRQTGIGLGGADQIDDHPIADQRFGAPVHAGE
jgi:hypothetical protein